MHRINDFIITDKTEIASLLAPFDHSLTILDFSLIKDSMSNTGYIVTTNTGRYFLKLYSKTSDRIEAESVLCHGDFGYGNIMISAGKVHFIDFEFAYSGSRYHDIGHFFRRKDNDVQALIDSQIYDAFAQGYNSVSAAPLPSDWLTLAQLCDINAMLCLLTYDNVPTEWVEDIENDILSAINEDNRTRQSI